RLPETQGKAGGGIGHVLAQYEHSIGVLGVLERGGARRTLLQDADDQGEQLLLACRQSEMEALGADQFAQCEIGLERGTRRANADGPLRWQQLRQMAEDFSLRRRLRPHTTVRPQERLVQTL